MRKMLPFLALLALSEVNAQSLTIGPNGISVSTGNTANDLNLKLDQNGLKITPSAPQSRTLNCAGKAVAVRGSNQTVTLTGRCPQLTVSGSGNTVRVAQVGKISVSGSRNTVYWTKGLTSARPTTAISGSSNRVVAATNPAPPPPPRPAAPAPVPPKPTPTAQPL